MNKKAILDKIINDNNLSDYFVNKDYKKKSSFKYCYPKIKNFIKERRVSIEKTVTATLLTDLVIGCSFFLSIHTGDASSVMTSIIFPLLFICCNFIFLVGLFHICLMAKNFLKRKPTIFNIDVIDMKANLSIEDHDQIAQVLSREEFVCFIGNFRQYKDLPLHEIRKSAISYLESERKKVENEIQMKTLANKKEKLENYADVFYPK